MSEEIGTMAGGLLGDADFARLWRQAQRETKDPRCKYDATEMVMILISTAEHKATIKAVGGYLHKRYPNMSLTELGNLIDCLRSGEMPEETKEAKEETWRTAKCGQCKYYDPLMPFCTSNFETRSLPDWGIAYQACTGFGKMPEEEK